MIDLSQKTFGRNAVGVEQEDIRFELLCEEALPNGTKDNLKIDIVDIDIVVN